MKQPPTGKQTDVMTSAPDAASLEDAGQAAERAIGEIQRELDALLGPASVPPELKALAQSVMGFFAQLREENRAAVKRDRLALKHQRRQADALERLAAAVERIETKLAPPEG